MFIPVIMNRIKADVLQCAGTHFCLASIITSYAPAGAYSPEDSAKAMQIIAQAFHDIHIDPASYRELVAEGIKI